MPRVNILYTTLMFETGQMGDEGWIVMLDDWIRASPEVQLLWGVHGLLWSIKSAGTFSRLEPTDRPLKLGSMKKFLQVMMEPAEHSGDFFIIWTLSEPLTMNYFVKYLYYFTLKLFNYLVDPIRFRRKKYTDKNVAFWTYFIIIKTSYRRFSAHSRTNGGVVQ